ncbi:RDD family protein [Ornithinibacillus halophilus]|uniref:Uncharacterized membrane protein YckC, RDD family n=1 Tax=Ornithinibacillus halophilus TaxID=930117 RepID=A0A1M5HTR2_9BACI|nr:RDD family protein [Ornithinibacillus halophilus]SHG19349.1 Uncharacterized membrane protein YckC, RDD family [Ornithinibacillus halophilus]
MSEDQVSYMEEETHHARIYAGFWMRFWAYIIDWIVVFSVSGILLVPFKFLNDGMAIEVGLWTLQGILATIIFYLYFLLMTKFLGQTLGKMILGIRVVREDEQPLSWMDLLFREVVGRFLHRVFWFTSLLYITVAFTGEKQGVHDIVANTRVVYDK